ncbi:MAG TPA: sigma-70 family RNA polymerase sigma factor [Streptosporangiaceae bacterium]
MTTTYPPAVSAGHAELAVPAPASPVPRETLAGLDDQGLLAIVGSPEAASESRTVARELLVARHRRLVFSCVQRYRGGTEPAEDLVQVGYIGLMKAISRFDPAAGSNLAAYAQVCISGEIKRHFRDKCWPVHVRRSVQDLVLHARQATSQLTQDLRRPPTQAEMARHLQVSADDLRDAQRAELAFRPSSLDAPLPGPSGTVTLGDVLGVEDRGVEHMLGMYAVATHWGELAPREQTILRMRFRDDMTQAQIGQQLGISQMHVSRLSSHALGHLRQRLLA